MPLLILGLTGCVTPNPETATVVVQPRTPPVRNITSFSDALKCMDDLFVTHGKRNIMVTSAGIPDATGEISTGTREMLISAISRMSVKSNAFRYIDYDPKQEDVHQLHQLIDSSGLFVAPNYYIRGAISQLDQGVLDSNIGAGISFTSADLSFSKTQVVSLVTLDMNVVDFVSRQILPGISANNSMAVVRSSKAGDVGGRIEKAGLFFNIALDKSEGVHQSVRTLVELGAIESMGKLTRVPYWQCLQLDSTNPVVMTEARDWYDTMSYKERVTFVQRALKGNGYYDGPVDGDLNQATQNAIAVYQTERDLLPNGRVDFRLYLELLGNTTRLAGIAPGTEGVERKPPASAPIRQPVAVTVLSDRGQTPVYRPQETLSLAVETSRNAYLYCYYRDDNGAVARIFPNRFQPDPYVAGGKTIRIPSQTSPFQILFDRPGAREEVACLASDRELSLQLPDALKQEDLTPLPVGNMDDLIAVYKGLDRTGLAVSRLSIAVQN